MKFGRNCPPTMSLDSISSRSNDSGLFSMPKRAVPRHVAPAVDNPAPDEANRKSNQYWIN